MKILYGIQGTGNGHLSRARDIIPALERFGTVDILISGTQVDMELAYPVKYKCHGMSFIFGKKGGIDYMETYKRCRIKKLFREVKELPVHDYDIIISDFEPVTAWACYVKNKPCVGLSHQLAVSNKKAPKPAKRDLIGKAVLKYYAPASYKYGFHFLNYDKNIFVPVIRKEVRELIQFEKGHFTVYLPSYSDERLIKFLSVFPDYRFEVFSKHSTTPSRVDNISIFPITNDAFLESLRGCSGVLCGAGFETPAEAIYLKKKLIVIPMKGQYEQQCNAAALQMLGVRVLKNLKGRHHKVFNDWIAYGTPVVLDFTQNLDAIIAMILDKHAGALLRKLSEKDINTTSKFRKLLLRKIFYQPET